MAPGRGVGRSRSPRSMDRMQSVCGRIFTVCLYDVCFMHVYAAEPEPPQPQGNAAARSTAASQLRAGAGSVQRGRGTVGRLAAPPRPALRLGSISYSLLVLEARKSGGSRASGLSTSMMSLSLFIWSTTHSGQPPPAARPARSPEAGDDARPIRPPAPGRRRARTDAVPALLRARGRLQCRVPWPARDVLRHEEWRRVLLSLVGVRRQMLGVQQRLARVHRLQVCASTDQIGSFHLLSRRLLTPAARPPALTPGPPGSAGRRRASATARVGACGRPALPAAAVASRARCTLPCCPFWSSAASASSSSRWSRAQRLDTSRCRP